MVYPAIVSGTIDISNNPVTVAHGNGSKPSAIIPCPEGSTDGQTITCEWDETNITASVLSPPFDGGYLVHFVVIP